MQSKTPSENNTDNQKPSAKDIYDYLLDRYKFELEHLWQRSVFLAVFLLAIAGAYGIFIKDVFLTELKSDTVEIQNDVAFSDTETTLNSQINLKNTACDKSILRKTLIVHIIPLSLTMLGIIFSVLWILLAKGSKALQEVIEDTLSKVARCDEFWNSESTTACFGSHGKDFIFPNFSRFRTTKRSDFLFSLHGGSFSVSKINITIGIVSFIAFFMCNTLHLTYFFLNYFISQHTKITNASVISFILAFSSASCAALFLTAFIKKAVASSQLQDK